MEPRAQVGRLVGCEGVHGRVFKIWIPAPDKLVRSRDAKFWEGEPAGMIQDIEDAESPPPPIPTGQSLTYTLANTDGTSERRVLANTDEQTTVHDLLHNTTQVSFDYDQNAYTCQRVQTLTPSEQGANTYLAR